MVQIKPSQQQVENARTPHAYIEAHTQGAFGEQIAHAYASLGKSMQDAQFAVQKYNDSVNRTKALELKNSFYTEWEQPKLYSKEGYYNQLGANASGRSQELIKDFDNFARKKAKELGLTGFGSEKYVELVIADTKEKISRGVLAHDLKQTQEAEKTQAGLLIQNLQTSAINNRNNDFELEKNLADISKAAYMFGVSSNMDNAQIEAMTINQKSDTVSKVIASAISEGSLQAKVIYDKYKKYLTPEAQIKMGEAVQNLSDKYIARDTANQIILSSANPIEALEKANRIENIEMSEMVASNIRKHFSQVEMADNLEKKQAREQFYNTVLSKMQNGQTLSYDDIPNNLDSETVINMMNYINKNGNPETDNQIWETLYEMSVNNAQGFVNEDLNKYRGFLSDREYKDFLKRQEEIRSGKYYSNIKDDDKLIKQALKTIGLNHGKKEKSAYSEIRAQVREYEARKGRKINDDELLEITKSLGYEGEKGVKLYNLLERGMAEKTGFIKDYMNDIVYYQKLHNGQMPSDEEKYKILQKRVSAKVEEKKTSAQQAVSDNSYLGSTIRNINNTVAKPNEQQVLTYFADNQVPYLSKELGIKLTVTSRFRNQKGSYHSEGLACDISMSEHNIQNRIRVYERLLALPNVKALGCSDVNILTHFAGTRYANKLIDERNYDRQHGTNHVNHVHVTLKNPAYKKAVIGNNTTNL